MASQRVRLQLAAALISGLIVANAGLGSDDKPKPSATQPAPKTALTPGPAKPVQVTPPKTSTPVQVAASPRKETVKEATTRLGSNSYTVDTSSRTAKFVGAAPSGAKSDLERMNKVGGTTQGFDGGRGSTLNSGVRPGAVDTSSTTARSAVKPATTTVTGTPTRFRSTPTAPPAPVISAPAAPSFKERVKNLFRRSDS